MYSSSYYPYPLGILFTDIVCITLLPHLLTLRNCLFFLSFFLSSLSPLLFLVVRCSIFISLSHTNNAVYRVDVAPYLFFSHRTQSVIVVVDFFRSISKHVRQIQLYHTNSYTSIHIHTHPYTSIRAYVLSSLRIRKRCSASNLTLYSTA